MWLSILVLGALAGCSGPPGADDVRIVDIHGLALDPVHPTRLYVATHHGLFVGENDTRWAAVTMEPFDMMGFTMHPMDGRIMYASGHPSRIGQGWAVGVVKSTDGGRTWTTLALKNEVDFHAMTMEAGPDRGADTLYGFHDGKAYSSGDGGTSWQSRSVSFEVASMAVEPGAGSLLLATDQGLYRIGRHLVGDWGRVSAAPSVAVATGGGFLFAYFDGRGLERSADGGRTWDALNWTVPVGDYPWGVAVDPEQPGIVYVGTARGTIHKTEDAGRTWGQVWPLPPGRLR